MRAAQVLLTLAIVGAALAVYHMTVERPQAAAPRAGGALRADPSKDDLSLGGHAEGPTLESLVRRIEALEARMAKREGATKAYAPSDLTAFREMLEATRREDAEGRQKQQVALLVQRYAKDHSKVEMEEAAEIVARYYADMRALYTPPRPDMTPAKRAALREQVDALKAQAEKDLRGPLGDEIAKQLRNTLPGGSRGSQNTVADPAKR